MGTKKSLFVIVAIILTMVVFLFYVFIPKPSDLIMTPSTHKQVEYLAIHTDGVQSRTTIEFAIYDAECDYIQLCFTVPKEYEPPRSYVFESGLSIRINDTVRPNFSVIQHTTLQKNYIMILLDKVSITDVVTLHYEEQIARITQEDKGTVNVSPVSILKQEN